MLNEPIQDPLFDLEELTRLAVADTPWTGRCPLGYTAEYYTPSELDAALDRWKAQFGSFGWILLSHMWHPCFASDPLILEAHQLHLYTAHGSCDPRHGAASPGRDEANHDHTDNPLPGAFMYQTNCPSCRWHHIATGERTVVEAWHDHAFPGWRALPVLPSKLRRGDPKAAPAIREWVERHYPDEWQIPGAPMLTQRVDNGLRPVPGRSPFGGYDIPAPPAV